MTMVDCLPSSMLQASGARNSNIVYNEAGAVYCYDRVS
jgi:hypothetical protein